MDSLQAVMLAIVQGLSEFLPISSSGHLILVPHFLGWTDQGLAFDVAVHVGTLFAVVAYFRGQLLAMTRAWSGNSSDASTSRDALRPSRSWSCTTSSTTFAVSNSMASIGR